jgi:hypothetical protein
MSNVECFRTYVHKRLPPFRVLKYPKLDTTYLHKSTQFKL